MAFCGHCGTNLPKEVRFCPTCGAAVSSEKTKPLRFGQQTHTVVPNRKKTLIYISAAIVLVAAIVICINMFIGPAERVLLAALKTVKIVQEDDIVTTAIAVLNGGSTEVEMDLGALSVLSMGRYYRPNGSSSKQPSMPMRVKLYTNLKRNTVAADIDFTISGKRIGGVVYYDTHNISVQSEELFGQKKGYGVQLDHVAKNLPKSIFAPNSGSKYSLDPNNYATLQTLFKTFPSQLNMKAVDINLLTRYIQLCAKHTDSHAEITKANISVPVGSKTLSGKQITFALEPEDIIDMMKQIAATAKKDSALKKNITDLTNLVGLNTNRITAEDILSQFEASVNQMTADNLGFAKLILSFDIGNSSKSIIRFTINIQDYSGNVTTISVLLGENPLASEHVVVQVSDRSSEETVTLFEKLQTSTGKRDFKGQLMYTSLNNWRQDSTTVNYSYNSNSKTFLARIGDDEDSPEFRCALEHKGKTTQMAISVKVDSFSSIYSFIATLQENDNIDSPKYSDILTMGSNDFSTLETKLMSSSLSYLF